MICIDSGISTSSEGDNNFKFRQQTRAYKDHKKRYSILNMAEKATLKRLNFNSSGNNDLILDAQSGENLNYGL